MKAAVKTTEKPTIIFTEKDLFKLGMIRDFLTAVQGIANSCQTTWDSAEVADLIGPVDLLAEEFEGELRKRFQKVPGGL